MPIKTTNFGQSILCPSQNKRKHVIVKPIFTLTSHANAGDCMRMSKQLVVKINSIPPKQNNRLKISKSHLSIADAHGLKGEP